MNNISFMIPMVLDKETGLNKRDHFSEMLQGGIDPEAFYQVGLVNLEGKEQNIPQGVYWMTEAANEGCEKAIRYFDAHPELKPKDAEWHIPTIEDKIARAETGDELAIRGLIDLYLNGNEEVEPNPQKVIYWERKLVDLEDPSAYFNMGLFYAKGYGVERDYIKAAEWMERAAENGDEDGESVSKRYRKMAELEKKAKTGDIEAISAYAVVLILDAGSLSQAGREKDDQEAIELSKIVAQSGDVKAITDLATEFMRKGNSLEKEAAKPLYQAAVELAKKAGDYGDALWVLALAYEHGRGVRKNRRKAVEYYKKGAELGHAPSQHSYGCFFLRGDFLDENKPLGIEWVRKSAKQGYNLAEFTLAKLYEFGEGVEEDIDKALEWGEKAAAHGDADTQYEVAKMFTYTDENDKMIDAKRARYWYKQAADQGNELALFALRTAPMWKDQDINDDYVDEKDYIDPEGYDEFCAALTAMMNKQNADDDE